MADPIFTVDKAFYNVLIPFGVTMRSIYGFVTDNSAYTKQPPWKGVGYIAGEAPDGLVTFNGAGAVRTLDLWDRATNICVASTVSASDGTYRFDGLSLSRLFDVRARGVDANENDLIAARIVPAIAELKIVGTYPDGINGDGYNHSLKIVGGSGIYINPRVITGLLPAGLTIGVVNNTLTLSGTLTEPAGTVNFTVAVDSGDGQTATSVQSFNVVIYSAISLLHLNGANGSNTIVDVYGNPWSMSTGSISTAQSKFGGSSLQINGTDAAMTATGAIDLLSLNSFTVEFFTYVSSIVSSRRFLATGSGAVGWNTTNGIHFLMTIASSSLNLQLPNGTSSPISITASTAFPINGWHHVAVCVGGGSAVGYIDGVQVFSELTPGVFRPSIDPTLAIGRCVGESSNGVTGFMQELRISKGMVYSGPFTPPTAPFS